MNYNAFVDPATREINQTAIAAGTARVASGAHWFWWIGALSLLDTTLKLWGNHYDFAIGLGVTTAAEYTFAPTSRAALGLALLAPGALFLLGHFALRGRVWAFGTGIGFYAADALLCLHSQAQLAVGLHVLALYFIVRGGLALRHAILTAEIAALEFPVPPPAHPRPAPPPPEA